MYIHKNSFNFYFIFFCRTNLLNQANKKSDDVIANPKTIPNIKAVDEEAQRMLVKPKSINLASKLSCERLNTTPSTSRAEDSVFKTPSPKKAIKLHKSSEDIETAKLTNTPTKSRKSQLKSKVPTKKRQFSANSFIGLKL